jgi:hypothetical protein
VHLLDQTLVALLQIDVGIKILGCRSTDAEEPVLTIGLVYVGHHTNTRFELVELDQFVLKVVDLGGKSLELLPLVKDFFGLGSQVALQDGLGVTLPKQRDVIHNGVTGACHCSYCKNCQGGELQCREVELFELRTGTTEQYKG